MCKTDINNTTDNGQMKIWDIISPAKGNLIELISNDWYDNNKNKICHTDIIVKESIDKDMGCIRSERPKGDGWQRMKTIYFHASKLVIFDFDDKQNKYKCADIFLFKIFKQFPFLENTLYTRSKGGAGWHFYCTYEGKYPGIKKSDNCIPDSEFDCDFLAKSSQEAADLSCFAQQGTVLDLDESQFKILFPKYNQMVINKQKQESTLAEKQPTDDMKGQLNPPIKCSTTREIEQHLNNIDVNYCDKYSDWSKIVACLINTKNNHLIHDWSKKSKRYDKQSVDNFISNFSYTTITIGTLKYYSKESNAEVYYKICRQYRDTINILALLGESDFAESYLEDNNEIFYHPSELHKCFYLYNKQECIWNCCLTSDNIENHVRSVIKKKLQCKDQEIMKDRLALKCEKENCENNCMICLKRKILKTGMDNIEKNLCKIKQHTTAKNVSIIVLQMLKDNSKEILMDSNPDLFCWKNRTFDLKNKKFYDRSFEDYITMHTGYDYQDEINNTEKMNTIDKILKDSLPNEDIRKCYLSILRSSLSANKIEQFTCINGKGRNGKGLIDKLNGCLCGNYFYQATPTVLTKAMDGSRPDPSIANMSKKRFVLFSEPEESQTLKTSCIKNLTGESLLNARGCFSNNTQVQIFATFIIECNERLKIDGDVENESMLQRYIDINFQNVFTEDPEKLKLPGFKLKIPEYDTEKFRNEFRITWFHYLMKYAPDNIYIPDDVKQRSLEYLNKCDDVYNNFLENYEKSDDKDNFVKRSDIVDNFKCSDFYLNLEKKERKNYKDKDIIQKLEKRLVFIEKTRVNKIQYKNILMGYRCKIEQEEEEVWYNL